MTRLLKHWAIVPLALVWFVLYLLFMASGFILAVAWIVIRWWPEDELYNAAVFLFEDYWEGYWNWAGK